MKLIKNIRPKRGQSLVETAVILPILLLMLLGVFEVGWILRSYLVLVNVNRESARFAARGIYLDLTANDPTQVGYEKVVTHTLDSLGGQLDMDLGATTSNSAMIMTYYSIEPTNFTCPNGNCKTFDCNRFAYENRDDGNFEAGDTMNTTEYPLLVPSTAQQADPDLPGFYNKVLTVSNTTPVTAFYYALGADTVYSRIDPADQLFKLRADHNEVNCQLLKKGLPTTDSNIFIVEHVFFQDQLVGFPIVTAFVPNPVPLYTHTAMQINTDIRQQQDEEELACSLRPIMMPLTQVTGNSPGDVITVTLSSGSSPVQGQLKFIEWDPGSSSTLAQLLSDPTLVSEYVAPDGPEINPPEKVNVTDMVSVDTGTTTIPGGSDLETALLALRDNQTIINLPTWADQACATVPCGTATSNSFEILSFNSFKITAVGTNSISFEFLGSAGDICEGNDRI